MRAPAIAADTAGLVLALLDFAESRAPGGAVAFARGYCSARCREPVEPRREPSNGVALRADALPNAR